MLVPTWERLLEAEPDAAPSMFDAPRRPRAFARVAALRRDGARPLLHPGGPAPARAGRARALRRGAARLAAAAARLRRPARRRPRRRDPSGGLQDRPVARRGVRGQGAVPDEVLRAGHLADPRRGARRCSSWSTSATARCCATSPTRPTCSPPSARSRRSGRRSGGPRSPATGGRTRPGCATGARSPGALPGVGRHSPAAAGAATGDGPASSTPTDDAAGPQRLRPVALGPQRGLGAVDDADRGRSRSGAP